MNQAIALLAIVTLLPQLALAGGRGRAVVVQQFVVASPFVVQAGVPVSPFAYVNPLSPIQYGAYYNPQPVYANPAALPAPQPSYEQRSEAYRKHVEEFSEFLFLWENFQAAQRRVQAGTPAPDVEALRAGQPSATPPAPSMVRDRCAKCHSPSHPSFEEHGLDLSSMLGLDPSRRLEAIRRVTSDDPAVRMPPATERALTPSELGTIVQELSSASTEGEVP